MTTGQCCTGGPQSGRSALSATSKAAGSVLSGALLALLPKCPLCFAAWLTAMTGIGFSATGAAWVRGVFFVTWMAVVALAVTRIIARHHAPLSSISFVPRYIPLRPIVRLRSPRR